ncbi:MCE family protein [Nocardioides daejeonensis]|uniref:MCE family protein n=1 Tax=Nocardioides daejeonensis TaxID=1046556 RepID=UPI000D74D8A4|nr:MCE family protein [Nocardioides daejeonensis]
MKHADPAAGHAATRRRVRIAQILLLAVVVSGTVWVADTVVGGGLFARTWTIKVELAEAGGLHARSTVTYRGQQVGVVTDVRLRPDGIEATARIEGGVRIPRDSDFSVRNLSAVGEQHLYVEPRSDTGPWLADGDVVARERTSVPMPMPQVLADTQRLMKRIDVADLRTIADELDRAFGDGSLDLRGASIELERAFALLQQLEPDLVRLLRRGQVPLRTVAERGEQLRRTTRNAALIATELNASTAVLRALLRNASDVSADVRALWEAQEPTVRAIFAQTAPLMAMAARHLPGLEHWLAWLPAQLKAMAGSTRDGSGRVLLVPKVLKNCSYDVTRRSAHDLAPRRTDTTVRCDDAVPGTQQRGSVNVPRP